MRLISVDGELFNVEQVTRVHTEPFGDAGDRRLHVHFSDGHCAVFAGARMADVLSELPAVVASYGEPQPLRIDELHTVQDDPVDGGHISLPEPSHDHDSEAVAAIPG